MILLFYQRCAVSSLLANIVHDCHVLKASSKLISGEDIFISLYGAAVDYNVRLDKNTVKMENTFISCASQRYVSFLAF